MWCALNSVLTMLTDKPTVITWGLANQDGTRFIEKIDVRLYIKNSVVKKWRSNSSKQVEFQLWGIVDEVYTYVAKFFIVGDSKTRDNVAATLVCKVFLLRL